MDHLTNTQWWQIVFTGTIISSIVLLVYIIIGRFVYKHYVYTRLEPRTMRLHLKYILMGVFWPIPVTKSFMDWCKD